MVITICSRKRPEMLKNCLISVCKEIVVEKFDATIVIVENDEEKSCLSIVQELQLEYSDVQLIYAHEPRVGIPYARNRAVNVALAQQAEWIAFIDDDELMEPGWLRGMSKAIRMFDADAFTGPVRSIPASSPPAWWKPRRYKQSHGESLKTAATNNTVVKSSWFTKECDPPFRFDENMLFTGGSDTALFYRMTDMGGTIRWVENAYVQEVVPCSRLTLAWQFIRDARGQYLYVRRELGQNGPYATTFRFLPGAMRRLIRCVPHLIIGILCRPISKTQSELRLYRGMHLAALAIGTMRGLVGWPLQPYRIVDGE